MQPPTFSNAIGTPALPNLSAETVKQTSRADLKSFFLGGIFFILLFAAMRFASEILMPIVLAFVLKLVLQPVLRNFEKLHIPRQIASIIILGLLLFAVWVFGALLTAPAISWAEQLPSSLPQVQERLNFLKKPMEKTQKILGQAEIFTKPNDQKIIVAVQSPRLSDRIFNGTQAFASSFFLTVLVLFFLLAAGDTFLRRLVEILPRFQDKRQAVDISQQIEHDISRYLLTITVMNSFVGIATGLIMWFCRVEDPLLWGTIAFLLNYIPILGPFIGFILFLFVGMLANIDSLALLPASLYLLVRVTEGSFITPLVLAKRFIINPVLIVISLIFWYWMWGVPGAILSLPLLAITKIVCDRIERLSAIGHFLEG